jgi:uncharacterized membrane protein YgdD (TMEM256/DUF423 family)
MEAEPTHELHRRKLFAGIAMIAAPLVLGVAYLIGPAPRVDPVEQVDELLAAPGQTEWAIALYTAGTLLFVYAVMGLVHLLRESRPWLSQIGGVLAVAGFFMLTMLNGFFFAAFEVAEIEPGAAATMIGNLDNSPIGIALYVGVLALPVGIVVLSVGLLLARTAPAWTAWLLGVGIIVNAIGDGVGVGWIGFAGVALVFLGLAPLGYELLTEPDEAWTHPATFEGFRPMVGAH